jgi:hypothetical protein
MTAREHEVDGSQFGGTLSFNGLQSADLFFDLTLLPNFPV